jgi:hypothetical protein
MIKQVRSKTKTKRTWMIGVQNRRTPVWSRSQTQPTVRPYEENNLLCPSWIQLCYKKWKPTSFIILLFWSPAVIKCIQLTAYFQSNCVDRNNTISHFASQKVKHMNGTISWMLNKIDKQYTVLSTQINCKQKTFGKRQVWLHRGQNVALKKDW